MFSTPASTFRTFLIVSLGILFFGDVMVFSAAQVTGLTIGGNSFSISGKQIVLSIISVIGAWVVAQIPVENVKKIARIGLFLALGTMILLFPFGVDINGNRNWVSVGPLDFQPSEVAKVLLIIWAAAIIEKNVNNPRQIFFQLFFGFGLVLAIVLLGGDLGSAVVIGLILATLVYLAGAENKLIALLGGLGILGVAGLIAIQPYRIARFTAFVHPFADGIYKNAGWQPAHSLMALGSGGLFGSGIGSSKQKW
jgi:cell division protein FtsW